MSDQPPKVVTSLSPAETELVEDAQWLIELHEGGNFDAFEQLKDRSRYGVSLVILVPPKDAVQIALYDIHREMNVKDLVFAHCFRKKDFDDALQECETDPTVSHPMLTLSSDTIKLTCGDEILVDANEVNVQMLNSGGFLWKHPQWEAPVYLYRIYHVLKGTKIYYNPSSQLVSFEKAFDPSAWAFEPIDTIIEFVPKNAEIPQLQANATAANVFVIAAIKDVILAYAQVAAFENKNVLYYSKQMLQVAVDYAARASTTADVINAAGVRQSTLRPLLVNFLESLGDILRLQEERKAQGKKDFAADLVYAFSEMSSTMYENVKKRLEEKFGAGVTTGRLKSFVAAMQGLLRFNGKLYAYHAFALAYLLEGNADMAYAYFNRAFADAITQTVTVLVPVVAPKGASVGGQGKKK